MERDYEKADKLLSQVVLKGKVRFSGVDFDLEGRLSKGKSKWTSSRAEKKLLEVKKTIDTIAKDADLIEKAMKAVGKKLEFVSVDLPNGTWGCLYFYVNRTSEKYEHDQIVTDRDWLTGEWGVTNYTVPSSRVDEFFERIGKGNVTFHAGHLGRVADKSRAQKIGAAIGALLSAPPVYFAGESLGDYSIPNLALIGMIPLAGAVLGAFGGRKFIHNPAREFLENKKEDYHGFESLRTFCALSLEEKGIPYSDGDVVEHNPK